jgi:hypothetical protein
MITTYDQMILTFFNSGIASVGFINYFRLKPNDKQSLAEDIWL